MDSPLRAARSFRPRRRALPEARQTQYDELLPLWSLDADGPMLQWSDVFATSSDVVLDIGFGGGEGLIDMAALRPDQCVVGVEVHTPGVARVLDAIVEHQWQHVRVVHADVLDFQRRIPEGSLAGIRVWFPDPWLKNKQKHRRLVRPDVVAQWSRLLRVSGELHVATDIDDYARHVERTMSGCDAFAGGVVPRPDWRPLTRFEQRGLREGRIATDLMYRRTN